MAANTGYGSATKPGSAGSNGDSSGTDRNGPPTTWLIWPTLGVSVPRGEPASLVVELWSRLLALVRRRSSAQWNRLLLLTIMGQRAMQRPADGEHQDAERRCRQNGPVLQRVQAAHREQDRRQRCHDHAPGELDRHPRVEHASRHAAQHDGSRVGAGDEEDPDQYDRQD